MVPPLRDERARGPEWGSFARSRNVELRALLLVSVSLLAGLWLVYQAKRQRPTDFSQVTERAPYMARRLQAHEPRTPGELLNLNHVRSADELTPYLTNFEKDDERTFAAGKIAEALTQGRGVGNVGALGSIRVTEEDLAGKEGLEDFKVALENAKVEAVERAAKRANARRFDPVGWLRGMLRMESEPKVSVPLVPRVGIIKSSLIVRTPAEFRRALIISTALLLLSFWGLHVYWRLLKFAGDQIILPNVFALCGFGFLMMASLRDPLRDTLSMAGFAWGVLGGSLAVAALTSFDYHRLYYVLRAKSGRTDFYITALPMGLALLMSLLLVLFGSGPGGSDAKVNLNVGFLFQPSEVIKILIVFFIAAYLGRRWELIQNLSEDRVPIISVPRFKDVWVVFACVAAVLGFFVLQKDLGPALLMAGLFLITFAVVRGKLLLSLAGLAAIVGGYLVNYYVFTFSQTAADRLDIWLSPWDTAVRGGEQIVQSFWALAAGGITGTGIGLGEPRFAPAAHTDLILSALGEEFGFVGLVLICALYATLIHRCFKVAINASSAYTYFLAVGVTIINALQILFIGAAVVGLIPLSGVVSPFLSYGSTSMVMNFVAVGVVLVISGQQDAASPEVERAFARPTRHVARALAGLALILVVKAAWVQIFKADEITLRSVLAPQADEVVRQGGTEARFVGIRRYQENPRIRQALAELPYGTIYDRNGLPLASSNWEELEAHRAAYEALGVQLDKVCRKGVRCYPLGGATFFLLGDVRTRKNWGGTSNYIEKDYEARLRGFDDHQTVEYVDVKRVSVKLDEQTDEPIVNPASGLPERKEETVAFPILKRDYRELLPLINYRYLPVSLEAYRLRYKERDVKTSVDASLQMLLTKIVEDELRAKGLSKGAAVVLDPRSGDLLASVSYPYPSALAQREVADAGAGNNSDDSDILIDRARQGEKPPGSTYKLITAMAAVRRDPAAFERTFTCEQLSKTVSGKVVRGRPVRDNEGHNAHGPIKFKEALTFSCNAYFAQLGVEVAGADELFRTSKLFNIKAAAPDSPEELDKFLPQSAFGQGEVVATPFQMAKVAATVANGGVMAFGRWVTDENNLRNDPPTQVVEPGQADAIARAMLAVTTDQHGTAHTALADSPIQVAGKTGTAQNGAFADGKFVFLRSHSWFVGFAPFAGQNKIAFAVVVENGGYGGGVAASITRKLVKAAADLRLI